VAVMDASVYVALVNLHEGAHASSWAWFERALQAPEPVRAPVVLLAEVAAALSRGTGNPALAQQIVGQLLHSRAIDLVPVTEELAERAAAIAAERRIRGCDAIYVALAEQHGDTLVTLDRQQLERGSAVVIVHRP
jgi:predicted nucleic acid-binding protein